MNSEVLVHWLRAMVKGMPHGGKSRTATKLGLSPSGLSKLLNNPARGFDEKTLSAVAWCQNSAADRYDVAKFPIVSSVTVGPIIIEMRKGEGDVEFPVWRALVPPKK